MATRTSEDKAIAREAKGFKRDAGHTYLLLGGLVLLLMLLSPVFNRYLETYQGVVTTAPQDGEVEVLFHDTRVETRTLSRDTADAMAVGDYLRKRPFAWYPEPIEADRLEPLEDLDDPARQPPVLLPRAFERYMSAWSGVVVRLEVRDLPTTGAGMGEATESRTMTVALDAGGERLLPVPDALVGSLRVGTRLEKQTRSWLPQVTGQAAAGRTDG